MPRSFSVTSPCCVLLLACAAMALPSTARSGAAHEERMLVEHGYGGFLSGHPDLLHHGRGMSEVAQEDFTSAAKNFRIAARFADKPSQAMLAALLWEGHGVPRNRALAYAWMDLASERGNRRFLAQREWMWAELSPEEQTEAIARGVDLYAEFGDDVAQPRLAAKLRRISRRVIGSRTGFTGRATIVAPAVGTAPAHVTVATNDGETGFQASQTLEASVFYSPKYWNPKLYFEWRDDYHERQLRAGNVDVGDIISLPAATSPETKSD